MLEQADLNKSGELMKEIIKGQGQFFNGQGNTDQAGKESRTAPERSPAKDSI
jgi:hypothetical protein